MILCGALHTLCSKISKEADIDIALSPYTPNQFETAHRGNITEQFDTTPQGTGAHMGECY